jgi:hypothetical protein
VGSAVLAAAERVLLLDDELSQIMVRNGASHIENTYNTINSYDLRVRLIATGAFQL